MTNIEKQQAAAQAKAAKDKAGTCPGCGQSFNGPRGLRSHQSPPFTSMGCKM
jgi:hypothetical protein